jgi:hypothetical protein
MVDLWTRVHVWLKPPRPAPLVPLRVSLFGGRPSIVRGPAAPEPRLAMDDLVPVGDRAVNPATLSGRRLAVKYSPRTGD